MNGPIFEHGQTKNNPTGVVSLLIFSDKNDKKVRKYTVFEIDYKVIFEFNFVFKGAD